MGIDEDTSMQGRALVIALLRAGFDGEGQRDLMEKDAAGTCPRPRTISSAQSL